MNSYDGTYSYHAKHTMKDYVSHIRQLLIYPVNKYCPGSCYYCFNNSNPNESDIMTKERVDEVFAEVKKNNIEFVKKNFTITYTGGSPAMHPNLKEIHQQVIKYIDWPHDIKFYYDCYAEKYDIGDVFFTDKTRILNVICSLDLGCQIRQSKVLNISNTALKENALYTIEKYKNIPNMRFHISTHIDITTDLDLLKKEVRDFIYYDNTLMSFKPVLTSVNLDNEKMFKLLKDTINMLRDGGYVVEPSLLNAEYNVYPQGKVFEHDLRDVRFYFEKDNKKILLEEPYTCTYTHVLGFSNSNYFGCIYAFDSDEKLSDYLVNVHKYYQKALIPIDKCTTCEVKYFCQLCNTKKKLCEKNDYIRQWWIMLTNDWLKLNRVIKVE